MSKFTTHMPYLALTNIFVHSACCDNCGGFIGGARIICLFCQAKDTWNTVDLCEAPGCVAARIEREDLTRPHLPTHDLMKVRRVVHTREFGKADRAARQGLVKARAIFKGIDPRE